MTKSSRASRMKLDAQPGPDGIWRVVGSVNQAREPAGVPPIGGYHHDGIFYDEFKIDWKDVDRRWMAEFLKAMRGNG